MKMNTNSDLTKQQDEIEALSSIYGTDFHTQDPENKSYSIDISENDKVIVLEVTLPAGYPSSEPPIYSLSAPWLKGEKRKELQGYLEELYLENVRESILYLWVERVRQFLVEITDGADFEDGEKDQLACTEGPLKDMSPPAEISSSSVKDAVPGSEVTKCPEIYSGEIITDRKSHFQPHLAAVTSAAEVRLVLNRLYENKKIANATHNMYAYRFRSRDAAGSLCQDCDDDGETNAGGRMLHLLQILNAEDVLVVVSRWYGGIQLGPDRFKHISNAARQVLLSCGYIKRGEESGKKKKKKHK